MRVLIRMMGTLLVLLLVMPTTKPTMVTPPPKNINHQGENSLRELRQKILESVEVLSHLKK